MEPATGTGDTDQIRVICATEGVWEVETPVGRFIAPDEAGAHWLKIHLDRNIETTAGGW